MSDYVAKQNTHFKYGKSYKCIYIYKYIHTFRST